MALDDAENPFDRIDRQRLARHELLIGVWRDLPAEEILADVVFAAQMAAFKASTTNPAILEWARRSVAQGAGHECNEWRDRTGRCQVCGHE